MDPDGTRGKSIPDRSGTIRYSSTASGHGIAGANANIHVAGQHAVVQRCGILAGKRAVRRLDPECAAFYLASANAMPPPWSWPG